MTIFNSLSWKREVIIDTPLGQQLVEIPACGWTTLDMRRIKGQSSRKHKPKVHASSTSLENELLSARFNLRGELISLLDKETGVDMMSGAGNRFCLFQDIPARFDAWDIDSMTESLLLPADEPVRIEIDQATELLGSLKLTRTIHNSSIQQTISLRHNSRRLDFETTIDWHEKHKLLKVAFPVNIHANEAVHEIQFGHIRRPNHRSRPYDADRFEVCNHKWTALAEEKRGVAILNDCKYGVNVLGNSINLTLLKSALAPDSLADQGNQHFTYAIYYWNGSFGDCNVVREGYELNCPVINLPGSAGEASLFQLDADNIILETIKLAEDGSDDIILRLYESKRSLTRCNLYTSLEVLRVYQTDMLERVQLELPQDKGSTELAFRPFEVKTLRLSVMRER